MLRLASFKNSLVRGSSNLRHISTAAQPITVAHGDGIGPEIMESTLEVLKAAGANLNVCTPGCALHL